mmetsp:Transcript_18986/g.30845  ORF Transcript_18986/g.30845 Transcript_18986/m.30845 type:complete len:178 (-) Transcript_18986:46-579(-)
MCADASDYALGAQGTFVVREVLAEGLVVELSNGRRCLWRWYDDLQGCPQTSLDSKQGEATEALRSTGRGIDTTIPAWMQRKIMPNPHAKQTTNGAGRGDDRTIPAWMQRHGVVTKNPSIEASIGSSTQKEPVDEEDTAALSASGWETFLDPVTEKTWWWHEATQKVSWQHPLRAMGA